MWTLASRFPMGLEWPVTGIPLSSPSSLFLLLLLLLLLMRPSGSSISRSPPIAVVPSSRLGHYVGFVVDETGSGFVLLGFLPFSTTTNLIPPFLHTHLINPCDGTTGVVGRHPCYLLTFNIGVSSHHPSIQPCFGHELRIWTSQIQFRVLEGWRFSSLLRDQICLIIHSATYKINTGGFPQR